MGSRQGVIQGQVRGDDPRQVEEFARQVSALIDEPLAAASVDAGAEATDVRRLTAQLRNRRKGERGEVWAVLAWISALPAGAPVNTQTVAFVTGTVVHALTANQSWIVLCDSAGRIVADVTVSGAGTRYLNTVPLGRLGQSEAFTWAA